MTDAATEPRARARATARSAAWPKGFLELYQQRYPRMVRLARLMTGRGDVAEELVQDCFLRVVDRWDRIEAPAAYLRQAVVNASRSHLRRHGRLRPLTDAAELTDAPHEIDDTWKALRALSPRRRAVMVLRYYEDLDDAEIAELLDCQPSTVRSLAHRAHKQLEEVLT